MTKVQSEEVRTSRWTSRWTSCRSTGGTSGSTSVSLKFSDGLRKIFSWLSMGLDIGKSDGPRIGWYD